MFQEGPEIYQAPGRLCRLQRLDEIPLFQTTLATQCFADQQSQLTLKIQISTKRIDIWTEILFSIDFVICKNAMVMNSFLLRNGDNVGGYLFFLSAVEYGIKNTLKSFWIWS